MPYNDDNVIPINPGPEEMVRLRQRMELLKSQQQAAKQAAKESKKRALSDQVQDATAGEPVTKHSKQSNDYSRSLIVQGHWNLTTYLVKR